MYHGDARSEAAEGVCHETHLSCLGPALNSSVFQYDVQQDPDKGIVQERIHERIVKRPLTSLFYMG